MKPNPPIKSAWTTRSCGRSVAWRKDLAAGRARQGTTLLVAFLAAWCGCAHVAEVRRADPGFTAEALRSGGLVVIGVVQVNEITQVRRPLIEAFEQVLTTTRRDIPLVNAARAAAALDDSTERFLLLGYQMHGIPDAAWLARAADSLGGLTRYGVLARVTSDRSRNSTRDAPPTDPSLQSPSGRILVTGRDADVSVDVYDLQTRARVFGGVYSGSAEAAAVDSAGMPEVPPATGGISFDATPQGASPITLGYPDPPPLARAAAVAFLEFARSLPGGPPP